MAEIVIYNIYLELSASQVPSITVFCVVYFFNSIVLGTRKDLTSVENTVIWYIYLLENYRKSTTILICYRYSYFFGTFTPYQNTERRSGLYNSSEVLGIYTQWKQIFKLERIFLYANYLCKFPIVTRNENLTLHPCRTSLIKCLTA